MLGELQFGQWNVDDAAAVVVAVGASIEVGGGADFFCDVSSSSPIVPTTSVAALCPDTDAAESPATAALPTTSSAVSPPSSFQKLSSNVEQSVGMI